MTDNRRNTSPPTATTARIWLLHRTTSQIVLLNIKLFQKFS